MVLFFMVDLHPLVVFFLLLLGALAFTDTLLHKGKVPVTENGSLPNKNVSLFKDAPRVKLCWQTATLRLCPPRKPSSILSCSNSAIMALYTLKEPSSSDRICGLLSSAPRPAQKTWKCTYFSCWELGRILMFSCGLCLDGLASKLITPLGDRTLWNEVGLLGVCSCPWQEHWPPPFNVGTIPVSRGALPWADFSLVFYVNERS